MRKIPVLFEDEAWAGLRPIAWSLPAFEIRCGMFNLRERVALVQERLAPDRMTRQGRFRGHLLARGELTSLLRADDWQLGADRIQPGAADDCFVWLNGRLGRALPLLELALTPGQGDRDLALFRNGRLVVAAVCGDRLRQLTRAWADWEAGERSPAAERAFAAEAVFADLPAEDCAPGWRLAGAGPAVKDRCRALLAETDGLLFDWIWQLVPATADILRADLALSLAVGAYLREPYGLFPVDGDEDPVWAGRTTLQNAETPSVASLREGALVTDAGALWLGRNVDIAPQVVIDTKEGPVILDNNVTVAPHCYLEGPLYMGPGCRIKAGARIYGETSLGIGCRVAGEIGESTFGDFTNKQHDGFIGHAVLGAWINLGALTTNSDLKNNYGTVRVDLGEGDVDTGLRFVGLLAGDHVKTAIGTLLNTGTVIGFASNIFGRVMPPKHVTGFSWGGLADAPRYGLEKAMATAEIVMGRRSCRFTSAHADLFTRLAG